MSDHELVPASWVTRNPPISREIPEGAILVWLPEGATLPELLQVFERAIIQLALAEADGKRAVAAQRLGITREALWKKRVRLGLAPPGDPKA